jgi:hypothetical protein
MVSQQCELPLCALPKFPPCRSRQPDRNPKRHLTTKEVVELFGLENDYLLRKAKDRGQPYRENEYLAIAVGRNRWELFRQQVL